ncbi:GGDEF domain-containing protein [Psychrobacter jeotgali]|uniref:GGDEF domain-containing protein n=1 Tax=Psychrobacter jeotgali TaxID=179010 RepID=UPI001D11E649|nr:GGDEF domain-containing protein [Psychrobacter jeotgali]
MTVSIYQLGYKKISKIVFEWQAADRASLLALFIVLEISLHWLWCLFVWWQQDSFKLYVDMQYFYLLWIGITSMGVFFLWMIEHLSRIKSNTSTLNKWQVALIIIYTIYITTIIVMMGYSSIVAGVTLVGGTMLSMMLLRRRYVWRMFLMHILLILLLVISPYFGINLPNLRQLSATYPLLETYNYLTYNEIMIIENAIAASAFESGSLGWSSVSEVQRSSALFWRATHMYMALPKAIFIVYIFRMLLLILDDSKNEILQHANQDELTQLKNRRYGLNQMQQTLMATDNEDYSVLLLDLDLFKSINDNYGHKVGDQVLREVADILRSRLANPDSVSRYGGEEFLITLPNTAHHEAMIIAEQLRHDIEQHVVEVDHYYSFQVTVSLGLYTLTHAEFIRLKQEYTPIQTEIIKPTHSRLQKLKYRGKSPPSSITLAENNVLGSNICQRLISIADEALYKAKARGRNQVVSANALANEALTNQRHPA